jgi:hypothetical protein
VARRGVLKLVRALRRQKAGGDGRSFMEMILDAANKSGTRASVNPLAADGSALSLQVLDDVAATKASVESVQADVEGVQASVTALEAQMRMVSAGLHLLLAHNGLELPEKPPPAQI